MPINDHYSDDADLGWATHNPGIIGGFCLVLGIALGVAFTQYWLQQDLVKQLAAVQRDVKATHHPLDQLTGFRDATQRTNSLLAQLESQSGMLYKSGQTIQRSSNLHTEIGVLATKLGSAEQTAEKLATLQSNLDYANMKLAAAQQRVDELETLAARLEKSGPQVYKAQESLASIELVQQQLINQQCLMPELTATVDSHWKLQSSLCDLASQTDETRRALDMIAKHQDRVQQLAVNTEESNVVLGNVQALLEDQKSMDLQVQKLADTLDSATQLSYDAISLNSRILDVHEQTTTASKNLDEMAWLVDYLNSQEDKIATAQTNLQKIDQIEEQVARLDQCVPALVENVDLVKGLNETLVAVLGSSADLRSQLAEIVLMQPAVQQLASQFRSLTSPQESGTLVSAKDRARAMIKPSKEDLQIPAYISRATK
ncbi:hypothetical protein [Bremerella cremea]|uniref:hypothetical protein n=1 Tax=Bremerella cremea TaxID=1031537 RepID=UPI0031E6CC9E